MLDIRGYQLDSWIYESPNSLVHRARRRSDGRSVVLKSLKADYLNPDEMTRYRQEYALMHSLAMPGVIEAYDLEWYGNAPVLVMEDFGGDSLEILRRRHEFDVAEILALAVQLASILGALHRERLIHKDINPSNIVLNRRTGVLKLIDFGIATRLPTEELGIRNPSMLEGTLAYMSPEQTGRMNRSLDYRTDFYSLGVTLYELLTDTLPFDAGNPLAMIHCHIAQQPRPPHELDPELPRPVSEIVMRLLEKDAEQRYQSAWGLEADLERCLEQWREHRAIEPFPLAQHDIASQLHIPQKLYGREDQTHTLMTAFERISADAPEDPPCSALMLVSGYSGIGKTSLVREIYKPITARNGYIIAGKFDQFQRNIPYSAVTEAFSDLVGQLLTESTTALERWRQAILSSVGRNGRLIVDVIPEVGLIIGPQPEVDRLDPTEAQNRFNLAFKNFIRVFCRPQHPLVLFLDDLQWADSASLKLLDLITTDSELRHMFLIGAYRDNEVDSTHPLMMTLEAIRKNGGTIDEITLSPLSFDHLSALIADTLQTTTDAVVPLARLVSDKTNGNPFFVKQFLTTLYADALLCNGPRGWRWDIDQIAQRGITDNVVELMERKLQRLPAQTREVLCLAACMGSRFDLGTLSFVSEQPVAGLYEVLQSALEDGLILATSKLEPLTADSLHSELVISHFKFLHDRVQQAAYALIDDAAKASIHLKIGRLLLQNAAADQLDIQIFDIVGHFRKCLELITEPAEKRRLAALALRAGDKAKDAMAYKPALDYLGAGRSLLGEQSWEHDYALTFDLHLRTVELYYLNGDIAEATTTSKHALVNARSILDKVAVYELQMMSYVAQSEPMAAIDTAREALRLVGLEIPTSPEAIAEEARQLREELDRSVTDVDALYDLPEMTDPYQLAKLRILNRAAAPSYNAFPPLFPWITLNEVKLCVEHGDSSMACVAYVFHAIVVGGLFGDIDGSYRFGQLSVRVMEKYHAIEYKARILNMFNGFSRPWKEHVRETLAPMVEGFQVGMEHGDIEFGLYSAIQYCNNLLYTGDPLGFVASEGRRYHAAAHRLKQDYLEDYLSIGLQMVLNLLQDPEDPCQLTGEVLDERDRLPRWEAEHNVTFSFLSYSCKTVLCYLFKRHGDAVRMAERARAYEQGGAGLYYGGVQVFYHALALLARWAEVDADTQAQDLPTIAELHAKLQTFARHAPMNFQHKCDLVAAERARTDGDHLRAMELYESAIEAARAEGFIQEEALAYELAAEFYLGLGRVQIAQTYMASAYKGYVRWEAKAKASHLLTAHPQLFPMRPRGQEGSAEPLDVTSTNSLLPESLDIATIVKASQAISSEIVLGNLLERILSIIMENAGAQWGAIIFEREGQLYVEALGRVAQEMTVERSMLVPSDDRIAVPIVQYVARTGETVVLDDASTTEEFRLSPSPTARRGSILCAPIVKQSRRVGILYLENQMVTGAFSPERLAVLEVLSAQVAISLENAHLYETLEQKVDQRTAELRNKNEDLARTLDTLERTKAQLVIQEKLASLGQLTAGIAHEIRNPLNFVNNFVEISMDLIEELGEVLHKDDVSLGQEALAGVDELCTLLGDNLRRADLHGKRAAGIVSNMLQHARTAAGGYETADINELLRQSVRLAHHGTRAKLVGLDVSIRADYDASIGPLEVMPAELQRVFLNILENAFHAVMQAQRERGPEYRPAVWVSTRLRGDHVEVRIHDNGVGVPSDVIDRIFLPFFTTKPPGEGTGLGLSLSHDIITQGHHGTLRLDTSSSDSTTFVMTIPTNLDSSARSGESRAS